MALVEQGLRQVLEGQRRGARPLELCKASVKGRGLQPGVDPSMFRALAYERRGVIAVDADLLFAPTAKIRRSTTGLARARPSWSAPHPRGPLRGSACKSSTESSRTHAPTHPRSAQHAVADHQPVRSLARER
jgi:hypothetical protein